MTNENTRPLGSPNEIRTAKGEQELVEALGDYLSKFHWQAYATPTFKYPVSFDQARRSMEKWIESLGSDVYAYVAYEVGMAGGRTHCHALLGGLVQSSRQLSGLSVHSLRIRYAKDLWKNGNIRMQRYDPKRGAAWYVSKCPNDGEIVGVMKRHRAHR